MPKVLCTLPNASDEIRGVKFVTHAAGMLSEDISDEQAEVFASIPGYEIVGTKSPAPTGDDKAAERAELLAKAEALGMRVKGNWSNERLSIEIQTAEKAASEKAADDGAADEPASTEV